MRAAFGEHREETAVNLLNELIIKEEEFKHKTVELLT